MFNNLIILTNCNGCTDQPVYWEEVSYPTLAMDGYLSTFFSVVSEGEDFTIDHS
jgi:hypothetical protein